jgi:hypothetical protein
MKGRPAHVIGWIIRGMTRILQAQHWRLVGAVEQESSA